MSFKTILVLILVLVLVLVLGAVGPIILSYAAVHSAVRSPDLSTNVSGAATFKTRSLPPPDVWFTHKTTFQTSTQRERSIISS